MAEKKEKIRVLYVGPSLFPAVLWFEYNESFKSFFGEDFEFMHVQTGKEALEAVKKKPVNMVICDISLGVEVKGKPMDIPSLNLLEEISKLSPKTHLAVLCHYGIIKNPLIFKQLPKDVKVFDFRSRGISELNAAIDSLVKNHGAINQPKLK